jgi:hypothetical protein
MQRGSLRGIVPSAITISRDALAALHHEISAPLSEVLAGGSPPRAGGSKDTALIEARKARMKRIDDEKLRQSSESGNAEEDQVQALVKKLGEQSSALSLLSLLCFFLPLLFCLSHSSLSLPPPLPLCPQQLAM